MPSIVSPHARSARSAWSLPLGKLKQEREIRLVKVALSSVYFTPYLAWANMSFLLLTAACAICRLSYIFQCCGL